MDNPARKNLNEKEALELFEFIEKNTKIPEIIYKNWNIWGIIRNPLGFHLTVPDNESVKKKRIFDMFNKPRSILSYFTSLLSIILLRKKKNIDILVRSSTDSKRDFVEGKYKCILFDDIIINSPEIKWFIMEDLGYCHERFLPTATKIGIHSEGMRLLTMIERVDYDKKEIIRIKKEILAELDKIEDKNKDIYRVINFVNKYFEKRMDIFFKTKRAYKRLFKKINPKLYIGASMYGYEGITAAAKELGIKILEFQHGIIYRHHFGYVFGKHLSKFKCQYPIPDYLFTYNKEVNKILINNSFRNREEIIAIGNLRTDFWKKRVADAEKVYRNAFVALERDDQQILEFIEESIKIIQKKGIEFKFTIKFHPGQDKYRNFLEQLKTKYPENIDIVEGHALNLYEYMASSDFHMSISSSTHFESICLGKPTVVVKRNSWFYFEPQIKEKSAILVESPEKIVEIIEHTVKRDKFYLRWIANTCKKIKKYNEPDAIDNSIKEIKRILLKSEIKV